MTAQALGYVSVAVEDACDGLEQVVAVIVPRVGDLGPVGCLADADVRTAERYLRARVLAVHAEGMPTGAPVVRGPGNPTQAASLAALIESAEARRDPAAVGKWVADSRRAGSAGGDGWGWR